MIEPAMPQEHPLIGMVQAIGATCYHDKHPFHQMMHRGALSRPQMQAWVANRFYYQAMIPRKDAMILSKAEAYPGWRRTWLRRIVEQDGAHEGSGGLHKWLALAGAVGLDPAEVQSFRTVLPAVKFAVDAYLQLVSEAPLLEAVASSLTELFAGPLHAQRLAVFATYYPWIDRAGLAYFESRVTQARCDVDVGLAYVLQHCTTPPLQQRALAAVTAKCRILWSILDALYFAYVTPGWLPPAWPSERTP